MNPLAIAIIGANYGDEGKGLMTDYMARKYSEPTVARFNGGAQAGHTVQTKEGKRHVFSQLSSGSFAGSDTYLSSSFVVNPLVLRKEFNQFAATSGMRPRITANRNANVSTIFDMVLNEAIETARGNDRHGSCGLGINETMTRSLRFPQGKILARDLFGSLKPLAQKLEAIHNLWLPVRMRELGLTALSDKHQAVIDNSPIDHAIAMMNGTDYLHCLVDDTSNEDEPLILEGAQGLRLDEHLGEFPHVTRSITGLPNAIRTAAQLGRTTIQPVYVTRCYATRHGAGPLEFEELGVKANVVDQTNVHNQWQGSIRYAPLDLENMEAFIRADLERSISVAQLFNIHVSAPMIALTCFDQMPDEIMVYARGGLQRINKIDFPEAVQKFLGMNLGWISQGPTAADITVYN